MSSLRKLASQTATYGVSSIVGRFLGYLLVPFYTRVFATGEYGVVTQLFAYASFLNIVFTYGLETAYFRYAEKHKDNPNIYSTILVSILSSSGILALIMILFSSPITAWLNDGLHSAAIKIEYVRWFAVILAFDAVCQIPFARLRQEHKAKRFAAIRFANILINIGFNVFFLVLCPMLMNGSLSGVISLVYNPAIGVGYVFISALLASVGTFLLLTPEIFKVEYHFDKTIWKSIILYALPLMAAGFAGMSNETLDRILLPYLLPDKATALDQLGIYGACYKLSIIMTLFVQTFRYAAEPFFFSQSAKEDAKKTYARVMHYFIIVCSFIFLAVMMYIDVVKVLIGEKFRSGLAVVPILLMANLCLGIYYNLSIWYKIAAKTYWAIWLTGIGAAITIILNILLIPVMGYMGAAWATLACYAAMMVLAYVIGQRYYHVDYSIKTFVIYVGLSLALFFISQYFRSELSMKDSYMYGINTFLIVVFLAVVFSLERGKISYLRATKNSQ